MHISPPPFFRSNISVSRIMYLSLLASLLPAGAAIYFFGYRALLVILTSVATALVAEYVVKKLRGHPFVMDGSALLIGLLLALTFPPTLPLWMVVIGAIIAIAIIKEAFGGLGHYIFSPIAGARIFLEVSFVTETSTWVKPMSFASDIIPADNLLSEAFNWSGSQFALYKDMFLGNTPGALGETSVLLILIAGIVLIVFKIIDWRVPVALIGTVALLSWVLGEDPLFQILAGGLVLCAFFIATDTVASPITYTGRIIFAIGCGIFTVIIRLFGDAQEGVYYAILLMNAVSPLIDRFVKTKPLGVRKAVKKKDA